MGIILATILSLAAQAADDQVLTPEAHRRGEDQTYLTYPEWFLVHSPAEYADYLATERPSGFPFFGHIGQFWHAYARMTEAMEDRYGFNFGYHVMIFVIGTSTTAEYALKAGYEAVFGRMFEGADTPEDRLAARVAADYVHFIRSTPWYEYDFFAELTALWRDTPLTGSHMARKWERRYALTTEYLVKGLYAILIKAGTQAGYERPIPVTAVAMTAVAIDRTALPDIVVLAPDTAGGLTLVTVPRYAAFKTYAAGLAIAGADFVEIAGNRGVIVTSVLTEGGALEVATPHDVLLTQQILTKGDMRRYVVRSRVADLAPLLREVVNSGYHLEHVYDY